MVRKERMKVDRREALKLLAAVGMGAGLTEPLLAKSKTAPLPNAMIKLTPQQDAFLDDLERRACLYFWEQASASNGQVRDRARSFGKETGRVTSIAATGFGLTAHCIADMRGYMPASDLRGRVLKTLQYHYEQLPHDHGFFFHFNDIETGKRAWNCEVSSIDTALLLCGVLTCRAHFTGGGVESQIRELATKIYERIDWPWMLNGGTTFSMGSMPETGFLKSHWSTYCELMMLYLLALGSTTHPVEPICWISIARPYIDYAGFHYVSDLAPLFTHQYSHAWFDFRGQRDRYINYFDNSITATRAHKAFCLAQKGMSYTDDYWGVTASDSSRGYTAWGGPPLLGKIDGSVVPSAAAGSLPFLPEECLRVLMSLRENYEIAWGRYGFVDAFNPDDNWYDRDVLGIDQGIGLLMAENLRSQFVWQTFMKNPEAVEGMKRSGFIKT
ncbi:glucoamylase family protein [Granulicella rosea]|nr:glucoamylase family protein [Granulicella rosea]